MSEPAIDEVTPRDGVKVLLGDNVQTDLLLLLHGQRRLFTGREIVETLDHDPEAIANEIQNLMRFNAIDCPKPGHFQFNYQPVGGCLHDIIEEMAERTRELHGLDRLEDCLGPD